MVLLVAWLWLHRVEPAHPAGPGPRTPPSVLAPRETHRVVARRARTVPVYRERPGP